MSARYNAAIPIRSGSTDALHVEDAEVRIIEICKSTVLYRYPKQRFIREIQTVIDRLNEELSSEELKHRFDEPLKRFAEKTLMREYALLKQRAFFFAAVAVALEEHRSFPEAKRLNASVISREYSQSLTASQGFRRLLDEYKPTIHAYNAQLPLAKWHKEYTETVGKVLSEIVRGDAKEDYGTSVNLRNIAEMTVRYEEQKKMIDELRAAGTKLAYIEAHSGCSKRCEPWQVGGSKHPSGLYSLDGTSGTTPEGLKYIPLEVATEIRQGKYINGCITGFNCRHRLVAYTPGVPMQAIPDHIIEKRRGIEQKQREYEREIRYQKRLYAQAREIDPTVAKAARSEAKRLTERYRSFSDKHKVAYFPERIRVLDGEESFPLRSSDREKL